MSPGWFFFSNKWQAEDSSLLESLPSHFWGEKKEEGGGPTWDGWDFLMPWSGLRDLAFWRKGCLGKRMVWALRTRHSGLRAGRDLGRPRSPDKVPWQARHLHVQIYVAYLCLRPLVLDHVTQHLSLWAFAPAVNSAWIPSCLGWANSNLSFSSQLRHHLVGEDFRTLPITFHPVLSNERPFSVTAQQLLHSTLLYHFFTLHYNCFSACNCPTNQWEPLGGWGSFIPGIISMVTCLAHHRCSVDTVFEWTSILPWQQSLRELKEVRWLVGSHTALRAWAGAGEHAVSLQGRRNQSQFLEP